MGDAEDPSGQPGGGGSSRQAITRRSFLKIAGITAGMAAGVAASRGRSFSSPAARPPAGRPAFWVPAESAPHVRTWMAWPWDPRIWGVKPLKEAQTAIATVARTIAGYEPVMVCADGPTNAAKARKMCGPTVQVIGSIPVNDCWMRDTGPIFRVNGAGRRNAFGLNFNGWGDKQRHNKDALVAPRVAAYVGVPFSQASIVGEGGAIVFDGDGTLAANVSSLVNPNRNPGKTRAQIELELLREYGGRKMLWFPGIVGHDITDDHIDADLQFVSPGVTADQWPLESDLSIWARSARSMYRSLGSLTDAGGRSFSRHKVVNAHMDESRIGGADKSALNMYVNYYPVNGALITNNFGDTASDTAAKGVLQSLYPGRTIEMLDIDGLLTGGGGVHCVTMEEPVP